MQAAFAYLGGQSTLLFALRGSRTLSHKKRVTNNLVMLGSAAVVAVYAAGYVRTAGAAQKFAEMSNERLEVPPETSAHPDDSGVPARPSTSTSIDAAAGGTRPADATSVAKPQNAREATAPIANASTTPRASSAAIKAAESAVMTSSTVAGTTEPATVKASATATPTPTAAAPKNQVEATSPSPLPPSVAPAVTSGLSAPAGAPVQPPAAPPVTAPAPATASAAQSPPVVAPPADTAGALPPLPPGVKWRDGDYKGWGTSRHGDIQAYLEVTDGKITFVKIETCLTQYSCEIINMLPAQVLARQSPKVDSVSGATQSANAFYYAVVQALSKAK